MRDARYAAYAARRAAASAPTKASPSTAAEVRPTQLPDSTEVGTQAPEDVETLMVSQVKTPAPAATISPTASADPDAETQLCGHRNIGNKSCRRPAGHAEKNHRYK
jgi:hypothetical protein